MLLSWACFSCKDRHLYLSIYLAFSLFSKLTLVLEFFPVVTPNRSHETLTLSRNFIRLKIVDFSLFCFVAFMIIIMVFVLFNMVLST